MRLTIGMAVFDDFDGAYFSVQALRMYHADALADCEIVIVDNNPTSAAGKMLASFVGTLGPRPCQVRYVPYTEATGTSAPRDHVFRVAHGDAVLCMDSHVLIEPGAIERLLRYYFKNPQTRDLLSGPMLYDNLSSISTHFADVWRAEMWGTWDTDQRGLDPRGEPFEIPAMGLGLFTSRREAWLGFNPHFRGFGGEEHYIHEKFRQAGAHNLCLPFLRWGHRFGRPTGPTYPLTRWNKIRNYVLGHQELKLPLDRVREHFVDSGLLPLDQWEKLIADPVGIGENCTPCQAAAIENSISTLDDLYRKAATTVSDINEHCPKLRELAAASDVVVEFGMRHGVSTVALLAGQPKRFVSYDLNDAPISKTLDAKRGSTSFEFKRGDSLTVDIEDTDLLFIDTKHTANQLLQELERHHAKVRRWIALHDTQIFGEAGEDGGPGLLVALRRFMRMHPEWSVIYHVMNNHGFTVISRLDEDKPKLPGYIEMAGNFASALAAHVMDGGKKAELPVMQARLETCMLCPQRNGENCSACGCPLTDKASWRSSECPLGKWVHAE